MTLRIVLFRENCFWLAQGLEHDIGAQGEDLKDLLVRLDLVLSLEDWPALPLAPRYFHDLWPRRAGDFVPDCPAGMWHPDTQLAIVA